MSLLLPALLICVIIFFFLSALNQVFSLTVEDSDVYSVFYCVALNSYRYTNVQIHYRFVKLALISSVVPCVFELCHLLWDLTLEPKQHRKKKKSTIHTDLLYSKCCPRSRVVLYNALTRYSNEESHKKKSHNCKKMVYFPKEKIIIITLYLYDNWDAT